MQKLQQSQNNLAAARAAPQVKKEPPNFDNHKDAGKYNPLLRIDKVPHYYFHEPLPLPTFEA